MGPHVDGARISPGAGAGIGVPFRVGVLARGHITTRKTPVLIDDGRPIMESCAITASNDEMRAAGPYGTGACDDGNASMISWMPDMTWASLRS